MKRVILILAVAIVAAAGGWFAALHHSHAPAAGNGVSSGTIYSCSMHPQVRSKKPGKCPFCGMALAPLSELSKATNENAVMLSSNRINVINVQTAEVRRQPLKRTLRVAGTIDDNDAKHRVISAYIDGRIDKLFVNYVGAEVAEGQPLASFFSPMLLSAEREYLALVKKQIEGGTPEMKADHDRLVAGAAQRLKQMGLSGKQIVALRDKPTNEVHTEIVAPLSGTVTARNVYEGQYVKEGEKLFEIADFATMWFKFDAYERDLAWLRPGQMVEITTPAAPGKVLKAPIVFIDPNINDPTRSAKVRVEIPNPLIGMNDSPSHESPSPLTPHGTPHPNPLPSAERELRAEREKRSAEGEEQGRGTGAAPRRELFNRMFAEGEVKAEMPEVLAVPRSAVIATGSRTLVYVDKGNGVYEQRPIKTGRTGDELWEVLEGLKEGERVVTTGNILVDAQAQLDLGGSSWTAGYGNSAPVLKDEQQSTLRGFFTQANAIASSLAADDLAEYNKKRVEVAPALEAMKKAFADARPWKTIIDKVEGATPTKAASNLAEARKDFLPFTTAVVELAKTARRQEAFRTVKIYKCPMAPKPGQTSFWIQLAGPLRNPFYGAEMIDCGSEVLE